MFRNIIIVFFLIVGSLSALDNSLFSSRREKVREKLGPNSAMIIFTADVYPRNGDVKHEFRPDSDYWYLTGHHETGGILVLVGNNFTGNNEIKFEKEIIFTKPRNPKYEVWIGPRLGIEGVNKKLGFHHVSIPDSFELYLNSIISFIDTLYINRKISEEKCNIPSPLKSVIDLENIELLNSGDIIHPLRHMKSVDEIELIQKAVNITGNALDQAIRKTKPGLREYQVQATIEFIFRDEGSERLGFPSIVASGPNATILHYTANKRIMQKGDLLLMDVGAEYHMYTADITRTIPVNGKFSEAQKELYTYVLETQKTVFDSIKIGMTLKDLNAIARRQLEKVGYAKYFIHGIGHWLGLDVHDVGGHNGKIQVGSVFTIEPGIYISENDTTVAEKYRGIGIRIEDDVLMTENGPVWLSGAISKEINDIESLMRKRPKRRI